MRDQTSFCAAFLFLAASRLFAQSSETPVFDVLSIKPIPKGSPNIADLIEPGRIRTTETLPGLLKFAFDLSEFEIDGPSWMKSGEQFNAVNDPAASRFAVDATYLPKVQLTRPVLRLMFQKLLADRFNLRYHREEREVKGYVLRIDAKGPKLTPSSGPPKPGYLAEGPGRLGARDVTLPQLARRLAWAVSAPVADETHLDGKYDVDLRYLADNAPEGADGVSLFTAVRDQLGLRLEAGKPKFSFFVVDRLDQVAVEN